MTTDRTTNLYRHFDADGRLLYVGVSINTLTRLQQHAGRSSWTHKIARVEVERFATRRGALAAESKAIRTERPAHNVAQLLPRPPSPSATGLGTRIREIRAARGLSQKQVAAMAGIAQPSLSNLETGDSKMPTAGVLAALCQVLGTTQEWLLNGWADDKSELTSIWNELDDAARAALLETARSLRKTGAHN